MPNSNPLPDPLKAKKQRAADAIPARVHVDTETLSLVEGRPDIWNVAFYRTTERGRKLDKGLILTVKPDAPLPDKFNTKYIPPEHNETTFRSLLENAAPLASYKQQILDYLGDLPISAHNTDFDLGKLEKGLNVKLTNDRLDTVALSVAVQAYGRHGLQELAGTERYNIASKGTPHTAEADAQVQAALYPRLVADLGRQDPARLRALLAQGSIEWPVKGQTIKHVWTPAERAVLQSALPKAEARYRNPQPLTLQEPKQPGQPTTIVGRQLQNPRVVDVPDDIFLAATARRSEPSGLQGTPSRPIARQDVGPIFIGETGEYKSYDPVYAARSESSESIAATMVLKQQLEDAFKFQNGQRSRHAQYLLDEYRAKYAGDESPAGKEAAHRLSVLGRNADDLQVTVKSYPKYGAVKAVFTVGGQVVDEQWVRPAMEFPTKEGGYLPAVGASGHTLINKRRLIELAENPERVDRDAPPPPMVASRRDLTPIEALVDVFGRAGIEAYLHTPEARSKFRGQMQIGLQAEEGRGVNRFADMLMPAAGLAMQSDATTVVVKLPRGKTSLEVDDVKRIMEPQEFNRLHAVSYAENLAYFKAEDIMTLANSGAGLFPGRDNTVLSDIPAEKFFKRLQLTGRQEQMVPYGPIDDRGHVGIDARRLRQSRYANQFGQRDYGEVQWGFLVDDPQTTELLPEGQMRVSQDMGQVARFKQVRIEAKHNAEGYGVAFMEPNKISEEGANKLLLGYEVDGDQVTPVYFDIGPGQRAAIEGIEITPGPGGKAYNVNVAEIWDPKVNSQIKWARGGKGEAEIQSPDWFRSIEFSPAGVGEAPVRRDELGNLVGPDGKPIEGMPQHLQFVASSKLWSRQLVDIANALPKTWLDEAGINPDSFELADADKLQKFLRERLYQEARTPMLVNNAQRSTFEALPGFDGWDENAKWEQGQVGYRKVKGYVVPMHIAYKPEYPAHKKTLGPEALAMLGLRDTEGMNRLLRKPSGEFKQNPHGRIYAALLQDEPGFSRENLDPSFQPQALNYGDFQDLHNATTYATEAEQSLSSRDYLTSWINAMDQIKEEGGKFDSTRPIMLDLDRLVPGWQQIQEKVAVPGQRRLEGSRLTLPALKDTLAVSAEDKLHGFELNPALNSMVSIMSSLIGGSEDMEGEEAEDLVRKMLGVQADWDKWFQQPSSRQNALGVRVESRLMSQMLAHWGLAPNQMVVGQQGADVLAQLPRPQWEDFLDPITGKVNKEAYHDALYNFSRAQETFKSDVLSPEGNRQPPAFPAVRYPITETVSASNLGMDIATEDIVERKFLGAFLGQDRAKALKITDMPTSLGMAIMGSSIQQMIMRGDQDGDLVELISTEMFRYHGKEQLKNGEDDPDFGHWTRPRPVTQPLSGAQVYGRALEMMQRLNPDDTKGAAWLFEHYKGRPPTEQELTEHNPLWWNERYKQLIEYGSQEFRPYNEIMDDILTAKRVESGNPNLLLPDISEEDRVTAYKDMLAGRLEYKDAEGKPVKPSPWAATGGKPPPRGEMALPGTKGAYGVYAAEDMTASFFNESRHKRMTGFVYNVGRQISSLMGDQAGYEPVASLIASMHQHTIDTEQLADPLRKWMSLSYFASEHGSYKLMGEPDSRNPNTGKIGPVWYDMETDAIGGKDSFGKRFSPFKYQNAVVKQITAMAQMKDAGKRPLAFNPEQLAAGIVLDAKDPRQEAVAKILWQVRFGQKELGKASDEIQTAIGPDFWTEGDKVGPLIRFPFARTLSKERTDEVTGKKSLYMQRYLRQEQGRAGAKLIDRGLGMRSAVELLANRTQADRKEFSHHIRRVRMADSQQPLLQMWNQTLQGRETWEGLNPDYETTQLKEPVDYENAPGKVMATIPIKPRDWLTPDAAHRLNQAQRRQERYMRTRPKPAKIRSGSVDPYGDPVYKHAWTAGMPVDPASPVAAFERRMAAAGKVPKGKGKLRSRPEKRSLQSFADLLEDERIADLEAEAGADELATYDEEVQTEAGGGFALETIRAMGRLAHITSLKDVERMEKRTDPDKVKILWDPNEEILSPTEAAAFLPALKKALAGEDPGALPPELAGKMAGWQAQAFGGMAELAEAHGWGPAELEELGTRLTADGHTLIRNASDVKPTDDTLTEVPLGSFIVPADLRDDFKAALKDLRQGRRINNPRLKSLVDRELARFAPAPSPAPAAPPPPAAAGPGVGAPTPYSWTAPIRPTGTSLPPAPMPTGGTPLQGKMGAADFEPAMKAAMAALGGDVKIAGGWKEGRGWWSLENKIEPKAEDLNRFLQSGLDVSGKLSHDRRGEMAREFGLDKKQIDAAWNMQRALASGGPTPTVKPSRAVAAAGYRGFMELQDLMLAGDKDLYTSRKTELAGVLAAQGLTQERLAALEGPGAQQELLAAMTDRYKAGKPLNAREYEDEVQRLAELGVKGAGKVVENVDAMLRPTVPGDDPPKDVEAAYKAKVGFLAAGGQVDPGYAAFLDPLVDTDRKAKLDQEAARDARKLTTETNRIERRQALDRVGGALTLGTFKNRPAGAEENDTAFGQFAPLAETVQQGHVASKRSEQRAAIRATRQIQNQLGREGMLTPGRMAALRTERAELRAVKPTDEVAKEAKTAEQAAKEAADVAQRTKLATLVGSGAFRTPPTDREEWETDFPDQVATLLNIAPGLNRPETQSQIERTIGATRKLAKDIGAQMTPAARKALMNARQDARRQTPTAEVEKQRRSREASGRRLVKDAGDRFKGKSWQALEDFFMAGVPALTEEDANTWAADPLTRQHFGAQFRKAEAMVRARQQPTLNAAGVETAPGATPAQIKAGDTAMQSLLGHIGARTGGTFTLAQSAFFDAFIKGLATSTAGLDKHTTALSDSEKATKEFERVMQPLLGIKPTSGENKLVGQFDTMQKQVLGAVEKLSKGEKLNLHERADLFTAANTPAILGGFRGIGPNTTGAIPITPAKQQEAIILAADQQAALEKVTGNKWQKAGAAGGSIFDELSMGGTAMRLRFTAGLLTGSQNKWRQTYFGQEASLQQAALSTGSQLTSGGGYSDYLAAQASMVNAEAERGRGVNQVMTPWTRGLLGSSGWGAAAAIGGNAAMAGFGTGAIMSTVAKAIPSLGGLAGAAGPVSGLVAGGVGAALLAGYVNNQSQSWYANDTPTGQWFLKGVRENNLRDQMASKQEGWTPFEKVMGAHKMTAVEQTKIQDQLAAEQATWTAGNLPYDMDRMRKYVQSNFTNAPVNEAVTLMGQLGAATGATAQQLGTGTAKISPAIAKLMPQLTAGADVTQRLQPLFQMAQYAGIVEGGDKQAEFINRMVDIPRERMTATLGAYRNLSQLTARRGYQPTDVEIANYSQMAESLGNEQLATNQFMAQQGFGSASQQYGLQEGTAAAIALDTARSAGRSLPEQDFLNQWAPQLAPGLRQAGGNANQVDALIQRWAQQNPTQMGELQQVVIQAQTAVLQSGKGYPELEKEIARMVDAGLADSGVNPDVRAWSAQASQGTTGIGQRAGWMGAKNAAFAEALDYVSPEREAELSRYGNVLQIQRAAGEQPSPEEWANTLKSLETSGKSGAVAEMRTSVRSGQSSLNQAFGLSQYTPLAQATPYTPESMGEYGAAAAMSSFVQTPLGFAVSQQPWYQAETKRAAFQKSLPGMAGQTFQARIPQQWKAGGYEANPAPGFPGIYAAGQVQSYLASAAVQSTSAAYAIGSAGSQWTPGTAPRYGAAGNYVGGGSNFRTGTDAQGQPIMAQTFGGGSFAGGDAPTGALGAVRMHEDLMDLTKHLRANSEATIALNLSYQRQQIQFARQQAALSFRQSTENIELSERQFKVQKRQQFEELDINRGRQVIQQGWQRQDFGFQQSQAGLQYGWQQDDLDRSIRLASGRERQQLMRQRTRSQITYGMEEGQRGRERSRFETQAGWGGSDYARQRKNMQEINALQEESFALQKKHLAENFAMQMAQLAAQEAHLNAVAGLEAERRKLEQDWEDKQQQAQKVELDQRVVMAQLSAAATAADLKGTADRMQAEGVFNAWQVFQYMPGGPVWNAGVSFVNSWLSWISTIETAVKNMWTPPAATPPPPPPPGDGKAAGGISFLPQYSYWAEAGPEAIIPLNQLPRIMEQMNGKQRDLPLGESRAQEIVVRLDPQQVFELLASGIVRTSNFERGVNTLARNQSNRGF